MVPKKHRSPHGARMLRHSLSLFCLLCAGGLLLSCTAWSTRLQRKLPNIAPGNLVPTVIRGKFPVKSLTPAEAGGSRRIELEDIFPHERLVHSHSGRKLIVIDTEQELRKDRIVTYETNERILFTYPLSNAEKSVLVTVSHDGWDPQTSYWYFLIYDFTTNRVVSKNTEYKGGLFFHVDDDTLLFEEWYYPDPKASATDVRWHVMDNRLAEQAPNALTALLTAEKLMVQEDSINFQRRMLAGSKKDKNGDENYYLVRWQENFSNPQISPFPLKVKANKRLDDKFEFSPDGKWIKALSDSGDRSRDAWVTFYHVDDAYPGGISAPVCGGDSWYNTTGAFLDTAEYGRVYIDTSGWYMEDVFYVYKMDDVLARIAGQGDERSESVP